MSENYHSEGGVVVIADTLRRARNIVKKWYYPGEDEDLEIGEENVTTVFNTDPDLILEVNTEEEFYCDFPDAGCC